MPQDITLRVFPGTRSSLNKQHLSSKLCPRSGTYIFVVSLP